MALKFHLIAIVLLFSVGSQAQLLKKNKDKNTPVSFQKDENGKYIFYEVVTVDTASRDTLWKNAKLWMRSLLNEKKDKITFEDFLTGTIESQTSFMVYTPSIISKTPHGMISYKVSIDVKDRKYRYSFTDFQFQFYKQDKSFKYVPVKGNIKPLEKEKYPGWQSSWNAHKITVKKRVDAQILNLKQEIVKTNKGIADTVKIAPVIKTKEW